jgi:carbon monoxide dehydrogenase subunit G
LSGSRPIRYELAIEIARPPAEVYAYLADPTHLREWQQDVEEVRDAPGGPLAVGDTFTEVRSFLGKRAESTLEATVAEPGRQLSLRTVSGPVHVTIRHLLEPAGEGTLVRVEADADAGKLLGLGGPLLRKAAERRARGDFERLKRVLEGGA